MLGSGNLVASQKGSVTDAVPVWLALVQRVLEGAYVQAGLEENRM